MGRTRKLITPAAFRALWTLWKTGHSMPAIGAAIGSSPQAVYGVVCRYGGIPPQPRRRAVRSLSLDEREAISRGLAAGQSMREIACLLDRAPSTISREIQRHGGPTLYRAAHAEVRAWQRGLRPKPCRLALHPRLRQVVVGKLRADWSPEQIAQWLRMTYPDEGAMHVSHETIYRTLYVQARGALKQELVAHLRRGRGVRHSRANQPKQQGRGHIADTLSIAQRPAIVEDRAVPGHWEGDLLAGTKWSNIATLVERQSRYVLLVRLPTRDAVSVATALARRVQRLPTGLMQTLTWDRGKEMAAHKLFTIATDVQVYFCDPRSPWQRGSNENTNGLLRQYFPKGVDVSTITQRQLDAVAKKLNTRPRQTLNWQTPAQVFATAVALTG